MKCINCKEDYEEPFIKDFVNGVCLPCQCEIHAKELSDKWDNELIILNARLNTTYDFDAFCFEIWAKEQFIKSGLSKDTPELNIVFDNELQMKKEYNAPRDPQLDLFSLPF